MEILKVQNLCKTYGKGEAKVDALKNVSFSLNKGEFAAVVGESGSGKSTLLNCVGALDSPTSGHILVDGQDLFSMKEEQRTIFRRRNIGFIFQSFQLVSELNVEQNIMFPLLLDYRKPDPAAVEEILELLGLTERRHHLPSQLSGGQQQRVAIARALVNRPQVLLLDEPLGALDLKLRKGMQIELKRMQQHLGITFVFVTHDQEEALTMSDTVVVMNEGVIQQIGTPTDIYNEPKNVFVAKFIGESNILPGTMKRDLLVNFHGMDFTCVDKGFAPNEPVDVVIRPEDIDLVAPDAGMLRGVVKSVLFMGVHYEFRVECGDVMLTVHSTDYVEPGCEVGVVILPDAIHIMHKSDAPDAAEPLPQEDLPEDAPELLPEE